MTRLTIDLADPENPIARVREIDVAFTASYKGEDAWNANLMVNKLERVLNQGGFTIMSYHLDRAYDANHNIISEDSMREYLSKKHGHVYGKCSSCPDPVKWKEVEKLRMKEFYRNKEVMDDKRKGIPKGLNFATGEIEKKKVYVLETQEERDKRLEAERPRRGRPKLEKPFILWDDKEAGTNMEVEPKMQIDYKPPTNNGKKKKRAV